ncbi:MAG TPA: glycosyltransferase family 4 protein [Rhizomicrobium sp.]|jgi:glycosyltransferase involved in cell wall biosynthesis|nr:glycosyltransferase family 4 protein [Rhizomicrobium sp.]
MRLLFIDFTLPYVLRDADFPAGGWATELGNWLRGLAADGHRAGVLTWKGARDYVGPNSLCDLLDTYDPAKGIPVAKYFYSYIPKLVMAARGFEPDVLLQATSGLHTGIMAFVAARLGCPFVYRAASDMDVDGRIRNHLRAYERLAYFYGLRSTASILCQNHYQFSSLRHRLPDKPLHILHNPFRLSDPPPAIRPRSDRAYVAWLAVFRPLKNLPLLSRLAASQPQIEFHVAGRPDGELDRPTAEALDLLHKLRNVSMVGYVRPSQVPDFLSRAAMLLSTSDFEGFSNTFLESFSVGTPVAGRSIVDPDGIIGRNSLGISAVGEGELQQGIRSLWEMEASQYEQMARRCQTYVAENHAPAAKTAELVGILRSLNAGQP